MDAVRLVAEPGSITGPAEKFRVLDAETRRRLELLEEYDLGPLLLGISPRRLLRDGRLFDNEQVLPLLLWFGQWDKHCRFRAAQIMQQWLVFNPSEGDFEGVEDTDAETFRDYFLRTYGIPLIEEFRRYVALCILHPGEHNAPPGPVDMVWHAMILDTRLYEDFCTKVWIGAIHVLPEPAAA